MDRTLSLYGITEGLVAALEDDSEGALELIGQLVPQLESKAAAVAGFVQYTEDQADVLKLRANAMLTEAKRLEAKGERLKDYLVGCMTMVDVDRITDKRTGISLALKSNPPRLVVDDEGMIPKAFWKQPPPPALTLDKSALKAALKDGPVPGAHTEQGIRLEIKG